MKKIMIIALIASLLWVIKLSYDVQQLSGARQNLEQNFADLSKQNATLNDRMIAFQREKSDTAPEHPISSQSVAVDVLEGKKLIDPSVQLIEFSLNQQEYIYALEKLYQLKKDVINYPMAKTFQKSVLQALVEDEVLIKKYSDEQSQQNTKFITALAKIDQILKEEMKHPNLRIAKDENQSFWKNWFSISKTDHAMSALTQRTIILKEIQLRLMLGQQSLLKNEVQYYQQNLDEILNLLNSLPDAFSKDLKLQVETLKKLKPLSAPLLNTRALIGD